MGLSLYTLMEDFALQQNADRPPGFELNLRMSERALAVFLKLLPLLLLPLFGTGVLWWHNQLPPPIPKGTAPIESEGKAPR